jgi:hypothetical protein
MDKQLKTLTPAQYAFMRWLDQNHPEVLRAAEERRASLSGFLDSLSNTFNNVMEKAPELMKSYVDGKAQIEQLKINIERAKRGEYPIEQPLMARAHSAVNTIPSWVWAAGAAGLLYLLLKK